MERIPTGFPELDNILDEGLVSPSCICISGQSNLSQRNFVLQMINTFLQRGLKGIYICLDRPAPEIRNQFKLLDLNIEAYDKNYGIFFVDFFTYSQNALIESSTLQTLEYKPRMLLETISPFLDWIKNGFIIIDTLSTLTLNMDSKEAYEFIRGLKLLGRAFNLVIIGAMYRQVQETDEILTNSDGNIVFKNGTLTFNHFERSHNETLKIAIEQDGKVTLKSPLAEAVNEKNSISLLSILSDAKTLKVIPTLNLAASYETSFMAEEIPQKMQLLIEANTVTKTPYCSTLTCPKCNIQTLEFYIQCPECQNRVLNEGDIIEHFKCGNIDFEAKFHVADKLVCGKCNKELKQVGVDYRKVGAGYRCSNKHLFAIPKMVFVCAQCRSQFGLNETKLQTQFSYELTEKGKREAIQSGYHPE